METLVEFTVKNGILLESYSVYRDGGNGIFIQNVLDADEGGPSDVIHIDPQALRPIALALLAAATAHPEMRGPPIPVVFPSRVAVMVPPGAENVISLLQWRPHQ